MQTPLRRALYFLVLIAAFLATSVAAKDDGDRGNDKARSSLAVPVVGTGADGASFAGTFTIQKFAETGDGGIAAIGVLTGVVRSGTTTVGSIVKNIAMPVALPNTAGRAVSIEQLVSCSILHLDLGPLTLNLLGLQIDLSEVVLDITAIPGAGNLLGNLLCGIAGLLDTGGPLSGVVALLNQLLGSLGL